MRPRPTVIGFFLAVEHLSGNFISVSEVPYEEIGRKHPARGVHIYAGQPTIVFLTVCTEDRTPWLADPRGP